MRNPHEAPPLQPSSDVGGLFIAVLSATACATVVEADFEPDTATSTDTSTSATTNTSTNTSTSASTNTSTSATADTSTSADADTSTSAATDASTSTATDTSTSADADTSTGTETDTGMCRDGVVNGNESDVDCGGDECAARCDVGLSCNEELDCASEVCGPTGVCAAVLTVHGTLLEMDWLVTEYAETYSILRLDFALAPEAVGFDGSPIMLAVSAGEFVSSDISAALTSPELSLVAPSTTVSMDGATGVIYYQSIAPSYFGVVFEFADAGLADDAAVLLAAEAADLTGAEVTLRLADVDP